MSQPLATGDFQWLDPESVKVIPQKLNLPMNFFEIFPGRSLVSTVSKNTIKMIGHHSRLKCPCDQKNQFLFFLRF